MFPQRAHLRFAFYGDDFTGSTDALEAVTRSGLRSILLLDTPRPEILARYPEVEVIGVAGNSRTWDSSQAKARFPPLIDALIQTGAPLIHYKVCSTFDSAPEAGSIGLCMEAIRARIPGACVPIVGATPHLARYCVFGNLFARAATDGSIHRLDRHPIMRVHPVTPMAEADLRLHLGDQCAFPIHLASLPLLRQGLPALHAAYDKARRDGAGALLIDGMDDQDLHTTGNFLLALAKLDTPLFVVGGSGVESALCRALERPEAPVKEHRLHAGPQQPDRPLLVVSGSASALSALQVQRALAAGFAEVALDPVALRDALHTPQPDGSPPEGQKAHGTQLDTRPPDISPLDTAAPGAPRRVQDYPDAVVDELCRLLRAGRSVVLHSVLGPGDPRLGNLQSLHPAAGGQRAHLQGPVPEVARLAQGQVAACLGELARRVFSLVRPARLAVCGGDTSSAVAQALDLKVVEMSAPLAPGAPLCRVLESGIAPGIEVVFKGGQMGAEDFLLDARDLGTV